MTDSPEKERRRLTRFSVAKSVRTRSAEHEHEGQLKDISGSGAAIGPNVGLETGDEVEVDIEDIGVFPGLVSRTPEDDLFAVAFDIEVADEDDLVDELTRIHDGIIGEEF
jgi:hypothetical protein